MTRTMFDSITATDIPASARLVAGYVQADPSFGWSDADWARFPAAVKVRIATRAWINDGHVLDVETGDATPVQAPGWAQMRRAAGVDPTVYCNGSTLGAVQAAFAAAGIPEPHYWIAHYDNVPVVPAGVVAKQYINDPASGGHYDLSAVADYWPGVDPEPAPTPAPKHQEIDMSERELRPSANGSVTLIVPVDGDELVISLGWTSMTVTKVGLFGPTPATGPEQLWATSGSQRVDAGRPMRIPLAPARAKGEVLTCEVDYVLAPVAGRDVTGVAGFRKYTS
jgi:hypothetical protein